MYYTTIKHNTQDEITFTFSCQYNLSAGAMVLCRTKKGPKLGYVIETQNSCGFEPTATVEPITGQNFHELSAFNKAEYLLHRGYPLRRLIPRAFNGYTDKRAIEAFIYKYLPSTFRIRWYNYMNSQQMDIVGWEVDEDYPDNSGEYTIATINFG